MVRPAPRRPGRLSGPAPGPRASHAPCCPTAAAARDRATKKSRPESRQPGSPRQQTPPRRSVMSGFPVCACERTLPFGSPADQGSKQSFLQLRSGGGTMLSSRPLHRSFLVATRCQNRTMCAMGRVCAASACFTEGNWGNSG